MLLKARLKITFTLHYRGDDEGLLRGYWYRLPGEDGEVGREASGRNAGADRWMDAMDEARGTVKSIRQTKTGKHTGKESVA